MIRLVDRRTGEVLGEIRPGDLEVLQEILEEEESNNTDYRLQADSLEFLSQAGLSAEAMELLSGALLGRDSLEFGREPPAGEGIAVVGRLISEATGQPLAGLRVEMSHEDRRFWGFSRRAGAFELVVGLDPAKTASLRITGLSDQELWAGHLELADAPRIDLGDVQTADPNPVEATAD